MNPSSIPGPYDTPDVSTATYLQVDTPGNTYLKTRATNFQLSGSTFTWSVFVKAHEDTPDGQNFRLQASFRSWPANLAGSQNFYGIMDYIWVDKKLVPQHMRHDTVTSFLEDVGDGWYRVGLVVNHDTLKSGGNRLDLEIYPTGYAAGDALTNPRYAGAVYVWGAQFELGNQMTPYQPVYGFRNINSDDDLILDADQINTLLTSAIDGRDNMIRVSGPAGVSSYTPPTFMPPYPDPLDVRLDKKNTSSTAESMIGTSFEAGQNLNMIPYASSIYVDHKNTNVSTVGKAESYNLLTNWELSALVFKGVGGDPVKHYTDDTSTAWTEVDDWSTPSYCSAYAYEGTGPFGTGSALLCGFQTSAESIAKNINTSYHILMAHNAHHLPINTNPFTGQEGFAVSGASQTFSCFIKRAPANPLSSISLSIYDAGGPSKTSRRVWFVFDPDDSYILKPKRETGITTVQGGGVDVLRTHMELCTYVSSVGDGWYRAEITWTNFKDAPGGTQLTRTVQGDKRSVYIYGEEWYANASLADTAEYLGSGMAGKRVLLWGPQFEDHADPSGGATVGSNPSGASLARPFLSGLGSLKPKEDNTYALWGHRHGEGKHQGKLLSPEPSTTGGYGYYMGCYPPGSSIGGGQWSIVSSFDASFANIHPVDGGGPSANSIVSGTYNGLFNEVSAMDSSGFVGKIFDRYSRVAASANPNLLRKSDMPTPSGTFTAPVRNYNGASQGKYDDVSGLSPGETPWFFAGADNKQFTHCVSNATLLNDGGTPIEGPLGYGSAIIFSAVAAATVDAGQDKFPTLTQHAGHYGASGENNIFSIYVKQPATSPVSSFLMRLNSLGNGVTSGTHTGATSASINHYSTFKWTSEGVVAAKSTEPSVQVDIDNSLANNWSRITLSYMNFGLDSSQEWRTQPGFNRLPMIGFDWTNAGVVADNGGKAMLLWGAQLEVRDIGAPSGASYYRSVDRVRADNGEGALEVSSMSDFSSTGEVQYKITVGSGDVGYSNLYGGIYTMGLWGIDNKASLAEGNTPPYTFSPLNNSRKYKLFAKKSLLDNLCKIQDYPADPNADNPGDGSEMAPGALAYQDLTIIWKLRF